MAIRIGINGVGRIGRNLWRIIHTSVPDIDVVAVNDTAHLETVVQLLRYDSIRGRFPGTVDSDGNAVTVDGTRVPLTRWPTPDQIDWAAHGVDIVMEATGQFVRGPAARGHLSGGAPLAIITTATPDADVSLMMGLNEDAFDPERHRVVSNSCCTTYCIAAMAAPLHQAYGLASGSVTVAYSHGSRPGPLLDGVFPNLRMARANAVNIVPANIPGVRYALEQVLPELSGRIAATAMRVPVRAASAATLMLQLEHAVSAEAVNSTLETAASSLLKDYLEVSHSPLVSSDVLGRASSCVLDASLTSSLGNLVRVVGWYDNEWGYAHRLVDLARFMISRTRS